MSSNPRRMAAPGPFRSDQIRPKDPYELSNGHAIFTPPTGARGGRANLVGGTALETDPEVDSAGVDVGVSDQPSELRAPDISVGNVPNTPGWAKSAPPLAVEYADVGQDEEQLHLKIHELLGKGTRFIWVVRLAGEKCVEIHEPGERMRVAYPGEILTAPGVLANPVPVEALYDRDAAHEVTLRNLLNRRGFRDLDDVRERGHEEGRIAALRESIRSILSARGLTPTSAELARIDAEPDPDRLARWVSAAATIKHASALFDS